jgi:pyridoxine 5-phosphate synthase
MQQTRLSVNLNKIALLRNSRHTGVPDLLSFAEIARQAGADGITVHPRPDGRHIRAEDVVRLAEWMAPWRPDFELNIEGYPDDRLFDIIKDIRPEQCTLVPDSPTAFTSEEGWKLNNRDTPIILSAVSRFRQRSGRVILFVDPDPLAISRVQGSGADGVEIYTGSYAAENRNGEKGPIFTATIAAALAAQRAGLRLNIGHDLNLKNLPGLMRSLPSVAEASIGHELTADALLMGFDVCVRAYKKALSGDID